MRLPGTATRTSTIPPSCRSGRHAPDTSYTYSLTSPSWTDPTGAYAASLDAFDRAVSLDDPADAGNFTWTYGTGGEVLAAGIPNGNTMTQSLDAAGHLTLRETRTGSTSRARYDYTHNRAGLVLSEDAQVTGDSSNGTIDYRYDPLGRLTTAGATAYAWDAATNRTGAGSSTTAFDAANRPLSGTSPTASYTSDADGQLTARPGQTMTWDHLGRLTSVTTASGTAAYTYDPLDRLRTAQAPDGSRIRFRYTGLTTSAAQWIDDIAGTVTRSIGNGWTGERLLDWTGTGSERRYYGSNAHHDVTWIADSTGAVLASLRYDPWGVPRSPVPQDYTPFRFQGSWHDTSTDLAWVVTRWYAPAQGTFISEDSLLGEPRDPDSRHLYAYGGGDPVGAWDPDGRRSAGVNNVLGFAGAFAATANFSGRWQVRSWSGEGHVVWLVENFEFLAVISNGLACNPATCDEWFYSVWVRFYNSAGTRVSSFEIAPPNRNGACGGVWGPIMTQPSSKLMYKCRRSFETPYSAVKIRIHWRVSVVNGVGASWPGWAATTAKVSLR